ncbi:MAG: transcriptional regulator [Bacteroidetes bacterium]|jgi:putative transcriptional regulator|nr:MAG: transcriptional regulator [Bacteroidota bacterium]
MTNKIRVYRSMNKISQQDLAEKLAVSRQTINAIENDKYSPSLELALKMTKLFDCKVEDLFSLED